MCDVHNNMTDVGMWVLRCVVMRKFEGVCAIGIWEGGGGSFLNLYSCREMFSLGAAVLFPSLCLLVVLGAARYKFLSFWVDLGRKVGEAPHFQHGL